MVEGSRILTTKRKPRIILDKSFPIFSELNLGDKGQMVINGIIDAERIETDSDGTDYFLKTIRMDKAELLTNENAKRYT